MTAVTFHMRHGLRYSYRELLDYVRAHGEIVYPRGEACYEIQNMTVVVPNLLDPRVDMLCTGVGRGLNTKLARLEAVQLMAADVHPQKIREVTPQFGDVMVDGDNLIYGAYGPRVIDSIEAARNLLLTDPFTRQAVVSIWEKNDLTHKGDKPCTLSMQFMIRKNEVNQPALNMTVHMRSNDVWLGVPYDMFMFTELQYTLARSLGIYAGSYTHHATSFHLYTRDMATALNTFMPKYRFDNRQRGLRTASSVQPWSEYELLAAKILEDEPLSGSDLENNEWYAS